MEDAMKIDCRGYLSTHMPPDRIALWAILAFDCRPSGLPSHRGEPQVVAPSWFALQTRQTRRLES